MSNAIISFTPACLHILIAPTTPPAGPERIARTGSAAAVSADTDPPLDCITLSRSPDCEGPLVDRFLPGEDPVGEALAARSRMPLPSARRYRDMSGTR